MSQHTQEPWHINLSDRFQKIKNNSSKKKTVVYIYEKADTSTFRYRAYNPCQALDFSHEWVGTYFFENELSLLEKNLDLIDIVVFCRTCWSHSFDNFFHRVKKYQIPTVFDVDDLVFNIEKLPMIINTLGFPFCHQSYYDWFSYVSRVWLMAKMCDYTFGTNQFLCEQLKQTFNKPSYISENFLNKEQIEVSEKLFLKKLSKTQKKSNFKMGYFSGTATHRNDFEKIAPEIHHFLKTYPDVSLEIVGFMEFPLILQEYLDKERIIFSPLVDFLTLQEKMAEVDVNLVPLIDNVFTNCKSELKFFEASIVGTITCATPTYAYANGIRHGETGFLCEEGHWFTNLEKIFHKSFDSKMAGAAREFCLKKYAPQAQYPLIENSLNTIFNA